MATTDERLLVLEARVEALEAKAKAGGARVPAVDVDIDNKHGDPVVRRDPSAKYWPGDSFAGKRLSQCSPEYLEAFARMAHLATKAGVEGRPIEFLAPLVTLSKEAIIRLGLSLGLDYGLTTSCYDPAATGRPCGDCDSCHIRAAGFAAAGAADPRVTTSRWH